MNLELVELLLCLVVSFKTCDLLYLCDDRIKSRINVIRRALIQKQGVLVCTNPFSYCLCQSALSNPGLTAKQYNLPFTRLR